MKRKHLEIVAQVIKEYHLQSMTIDEQIKRIEIAEAEGANIMVGHTAISKALELLTEELQPYLQHLDDCDYYDDLKVGNNCSCKLDEIINGK